MRVVTKEEAPTLQNEAAEEFTEAWYKKCGWHLPDEAIAKWWPYAA